MVMLYHDFFLVVYITYLAYAVFYKNKKKKIVCGPYRDLHGPAKALGGGLSASSFLAPN
jgi:hypothetical protein